MMSSQPSSSQVSLRTYRPITVRLILGICPNFIALPFPGRLEELIRRALRQVPSDDLGWSAADPLADPQGGAAGNA
ncbi:hypothetical protein ACH35V_04280 [Actinomadura sp. 1N219]|uniref:hypothetical protein n=1 Tax=Actinomadura sp. 1N219 TaxID=3375152 RepID=UPI0037AD5BA2